MIAAYSHDPTGSTAWTPVTEVPMPNGGVSLRKANGKFVCITPEGTEEERDVADIWETFWVSGGLYVGPRDSATLGTVVWTLFRAAYGS